MRKRGIKSFLCFQAHALRGGPGTEPRVPSFPEDAAEHRKPNVSRGYILQHRTPKHTKMQTDYFHHRT